MQRIANLLSQQLIAATDTKDSHALLQTLENLGFKTRLAQIVHVFNGVFTARQNQEVRSTDCIPRLDIADRNIRLDF